MVVALSTAFPQKADSDTVASNDQLLVTPVDLSGDRVRSSLESGTVLLNDSIRSSQSLPADYRIGPGDILNVDVRGRVDLRYGQTYGTESASNINPKKNYIVLPDGNVNLPLLGSVEVAGKTVSELKPILKEKLSEYYKHFDVDVSVSQPATIKVWVSGMVLDPGPQVLPSSATLLEALLKAKVLPTGSTRRVRLTRHGNNQEADVFRMVSRGELQSNIPLLDGDEIFVPPATDWVTVTGEVSRQGQFEMIPLYGSAGDKCHVKDIIELCQGLLPTAAKSNAVIQRQNPDGNVMAIKVDLSGQDNPELQPGDNLIIPSITDYQPTVRLVGEFKGEGVYQRSAGNVLNKSGVYKLAEGETAGDVIIRTGGTTPQADLKHAKIERRNGDKIEILPLDLERVLTYKDRSADIVLKSGDTLILPALQDRVFVFGEVVRPGGFTYEPDGRLLDYLARAGGPGGRAKSTVVIVRGSADGDNEIIKVDTTRGFKGQSKDNPVMQPGDIVYVPEKTITGWRDISQIISTIRLLTLL